MIYTKDNPKLVDDIFKSINNFTGFVKDQFGDIAHYVNGKLHRENGPAIEYENGTKWWFLNGKRHREDGPAVTFIDGDKTWYLNGKCYGYNNDYTIESWVRLVKLELLK